MKNKSAILSSLVVVGLLIVSCTAARNKTPLAGQVFPTPTNHFLLQGKAPIGTSDSSISLSGVPTIANVFRAAPSATPSAAATSPATIIVESTLTKLATPQLYTVAVYEDDLDPNWEVQQDTKMRFDLKSSSEVYRGHAALSFTPRNKGDATLFITVSDQSQDVYRRDQVAKLSFWLYSPKTLLYLDQFFVTFVGSKRLPYWSAEDQKVANYLSVFPQISLDDLGFDRAVPADTWVMVEINLDEALTSEPEYQYVNGISFKSTVGHMLLVDEIRLVLLGKPPRP